nr:MAG TPA: hyaluronase tail fiber protein [Caudoviricetes sp.]
MRQFNGSDYDTLYPRTTPSQVSGLYDSVYTKDQVNSLFNQCVLLDGSRAMTGNLNMNNHYIPNVLTGSSDGDAVRKDYVDNLIASCAKIQTGSYVGTGTYGPSNPVTLTFNFMPKLFIISIAQHFGKGQGELYSLYSDCAIHYTNSSTRYVWGSIAANISINNNAVVIYDIYQDNVLNYLNGTYNYVCIG